MRLKLDENFDLRIVPVLAQRGHDVEDVYGENLSGSRDKAIYEACIRERRTLITLDLDFSNPFRFPPEETVVGLKRNSSRTRRSHLSLFLPVPDNLRP